MQRMAPADTADNWESQVRKGWLELAILAGLWSSRLYGLEILRRLETDSDLVVAEGTIYPILNRLKRDGLIDRHASGFLGRIQDLLGPILEEEK